MTSENYDLIEQKIIDNLSLFGRMANHNEYTETDWTNGIKFVFNAIGNELGYKSFFHWIKRGADHLIKFSKKFKKYWV